jgi:hypothetical protein
MSIQEFFKPVQEGMCMFLAHTGANQNEILDISPFRQGSQAFASKPAVRFASARFCQCIEGESVVSESLMADETSGGEAIESAIDLANIRFRPVWRTS